MDKVSILDLVSADFSLALDKIIRDVANNPAFKSLTPLELTEQFSFAVNEYIREYMTNELLTIVFTRWRKNEYGLNDIKHG